VRLGLLEAPAHHATGFGGVGTTEDDSSAERSNEQQNKRTPPFGRGSQFAVSQNSRAGTSR